MRIRLVKQHTITKYVFRNQNSKKYFDEWLVKLKYADWSNTNDIKLTYNSADILGKSSSRIVFNIGGNHYRMICKFHFGKTKVHLYIMWIGTHAGYTELFDGDLQYTIKLY
jgi:mRNA interferase HigB